MLFDLRVDIGECPDRARDGAGGDFRARRDQPRPAAVELGIGLRELEPEGHRFGMDAVAAPDRRGVFVLFRAALDGRQQRVEIGQQDVGRAHQLDRKRGVEHVRTGHALVHEARLFAHVLRDPGKEGDHIVLGDRFDRVDRLDIDLRIGRPPVPQGLGGAFGHDAQFAELLGRVRLDLEPDAILRFGLPQSSHFGTGVAGDHGKLRIAVVGGNVAAARLGATE